VSPAENFELLRAMIERSTGVKVILDPSTIRTDAPLARLAPGRIAFRREAQGDWDDPVLVFELELEFGAQVEGTGLGFKKTIEAALAILTFFSLGEVPLEDADGERLSGGAMVSGVPAEEARFLPQEDPDRFFEDVDRWKVSLTVPYALL
jgi:hypothetical protein